MNNINGWFLTDDDSLQFCKKSDFKEKEYSLIEYSLINPDKNIYIVYTDDISFEDFWGKNQEELLSILSSFGYEGDNKESLDVISKMKDVYGEDVYQVCCECIFEYYSYLESTILFTGCEQACRNFILEYIENN